MTFLHKLAQRLARLWTASVIPFVVVTACKLPTARSTAPPDAVAKLDLSPSNLSLLTDRTADFVVVALTASNDTIDVSLRWTTNGGSIAPMSDVGGVQYAQYHAPLQAGSYKVFAQTTTGGVTDSSVVSVSVVPVASVGVAPAALSLTVGQTGQVTAIPSDASGNPLSGRVVTWTTNGAAVATVNGNGLVTAQGTGTATITATSEGQSGTAAITVTAPPPPPPPPPPVPVASVSVAPTSLSLTVGQTGQLTATPRDASGNPLSGRVVTWTTSSAAVATVNSNGLVTAQGAGSATITAVSEGKSGTATTSVSNVPVASVTVSPATASMIVGQTVQLTATLKDASGNVLTGRTVTWTSSNGGAATVNGTGLVTAVAAGTAIITAACEGKSSTSTVTVNPPVASVSVTPATLSLTVAQTGQLTATPRDASGNPLSGRVVAWTTNIAAVATVNSTGLVTAQGAGTATVTATSEGKSGTAAITVTASSGGSVLFQEAFEDNSFASRGWYDDNGMVATTAQHAPGGTRSLEVHYALGATTPPWGAARHLFPASPTVYVSFWVKYSDNWVGSGKPYHPHEFMIMSDLDGDYNGPSNSWLVAYIEHVYQNGGVAHLALQDSKAINMNYGPLPVNLIGVTEDRSTAGCNGVVETNVVTSCFSLPPWFNDKELIASQISFQPNPGPGYKGNWNHVEAYFAINSIVGGIGQADGVAQYWFNGTLVIDRHDILFRTGARSSINFHQFLIAPYIGDGSPVDQYMWVDDLIVATAKP